MEAKCMHEYGEIAGGNLWSRKIRTLFRRLDTNGHGYLMIDDILDIVTTVLNNFPKMETYRSDELAKVMVNLWYDIISGQGDESARTAAMVAQDAFLDNWLKALKGEFKAEFNQELVDPLFDAADGDSDGLISQQEFSLLMTGFKAPKNDCELVFKTIAKGKMSKDQFRHLFADFFGTDNPKSPVNKLWGALVNYKSAKDYPEVQCSPVWEGKMRTMFRRLDIGQSGVLRCHNFIQIGRSLAQRNHLDKKKSAAVLRCMLSIWVKFIAVDKSVFESGKRGKHLSSINERDFIKNLRQMINGDFRHEIDQFGWTFFKAVEVDGNGYLSMTEYRNLQEAWNVGREEAEGMFKVIDRDKDNMISADEYLNAWVEYFLGEDSSSPYKAFFGPVIVRHQDNRTFDDEEEQS